MEPVDRGGDYRGGVAVDTHTSNTPPTPHHTPTRKANTHCTNATHDSTLGITQRESTGATRPVSQHTRSMQGGTAIHITKHQKLKGRTACSHSRLPRASTCGARHTCPSARRIKSRVQQRLRNSKAELKAPHPLSLVPRARAHSPYPPLPTSRARASQTLHETRAIVP